MPDSQDNASKWINVALVVALLLAPVCWYVATVSSGPEKSLETQAEQEQNRAARIEEKSWRKPHCDVCQRRGHKVSIKCLLFQIESGAPASLALISAEMQFFASEPPPPGLIITNPKGYKAWRVCWDNSRAKPPRFVIDGDVYTGCVLKASDVKDVSTFELRTSE